MQSLNLSKYFWLLPIFLAAEIYTSWYTASIIGIWWSIVWIFGMIIIGVALLKRTHIAIALSFQSFLASGMSINALYRQNIAYIMGAVLLIVPGMLSDMAGFLVLFYAFYLQTIGTISPKTNLKSNKGSDDVIDAEFISNDAIDHDCNGHNSL